MPKLSVIKEISAPGRRRRSPLARKQNFSFEFQKQHLYFSFMLKITKI
jgi:hypothetical protein